jgi:chitodextrinase
VVNNNPPAAPTNLKASVRPGKVTLTWGASSGATSYNVSRNGVTIASVTGTSYVNTSVTKGTAYTYQVFAVNNVGTSAGSNTVKVTAK